MQLRAQGGAKVRSRITRLLGIALRNFRRARVERVHAEWQRLEAAAAAAAEAAAERERAFRSRCVHTAQVCANLRMLFWRAWAQKPEGRTARRDRYIYRRVSRLCKASGVGRQMVSQGSKRHRTPPASSYPSPSSASRDGAAPLALMPPWMVDPRDPVSPVSPSVLAKRPKKPRSLVFS